MSAPKFFAIFDEFGWHVSKVLYPTLTEASFALEKSKNGKSIAEVNASGEILKIYTDFECEQAIQRFQNPMI